MQTINILTQLISIVSTHERANNAGLFEVVEYVESLFVHHSDVYITRYEYNGYPSVVISNTRDTEVDIIFSGHLDVVDGPAELFIPRVDDDWLYGRGAMDMKSGVAAMISVFMQYAATGPKMALLLTTDEEIGGFNGTKELLDTAGYRAAVAIVPDGGYHHAHIANKEKGIMRAHITATGVSAHASRPWQGANAIHNLISALIDIEILQTSFQQQALELDWYTTFNLSQIRGGEAMNSVPSLAVADYDIRYIESDTPEQLTNALQSICSRHDEVALTISVIAPNVYVDPNNSYIQQYRTAIKAVGEKSELTKDFGASDARFFAEHNIPVILSQPYGLDWHSDNERVSIHSLDTFEKILSYFVTHIK
jgi:succinyl-diaminopimelate desuccinylase